MASSREERLQMRQRGAGTRKIQEVDFGFSFGSPVAAAPATGNQSTADIATSIDQVVQQQPTQTRTQTPPQARNEATTTTTQSPRSQPRSPRTKQTPRLSAGHVAADEEQGRSSKRRKIDSTNGDSNHSPSARRESVATTNQEPTVNESQQAEETQETVATTNAETQNNHPVTHNQDANPPTPTEEPEASAKPKRGRRKSSVPKATQPAPEEATESSPSTREQNNKATKTTRGRRQTDSTQPVESNEPTSQQANQPAADEPENEAQPEPKRKRRGRSSQVTTTVDTSPKERASGTRPRKQRQQLAPTEPEPEPADTEDENESVQPKRKRRKSAKNAEREPEPEEEQEPEPAQTKKRKGKQKATESDAQEGPSRQRERSQDQPEPSPPAESAQPSKRRRGRPSAATANEPSNEASTEPRTRRSRPSSEDGGERRREGTVAITVHRLADTSALEGTAPESDASSDETDELDTRKTFPRRAGVNAADVLGQICQEIVDKHLTGLSNSVANESNQTKRGEAGRQRKAVEAYGSQLQGRLFELSELLESNFALGVKLKKAKRETTEMRNRLLEVRRQRHEVALRMDAVRQKHSAEESAKMSRNAINNSLHQLESTLERSRALPGERAGNDDDNSIAGLEFTLRTVAEDVSSAAEGSHGGLLGQVRAFNAQLETTAKTLGL